MATLEAQLQTCTLNDTCKGDLRHHVEELQLQSSMLPTKNVTLCDENLPFAVTAATRSSTFRSTAAGNASQKAASERFQATKKQQMDFEATQASSCAIPCETYFKSCSTKTIDPPKVSDPFRNSRSRAELSGKDKDFVCRYAEALTGGPVERNPGTDDASVAAVEAYKKAFRAYKGRDPTAKELQEVDRLNFGFDEMGNVGVVQKPHSCYPHLHRSNCLTPCTQCASQVYTPEVPQVRAARSRFPGVVPTWTSTKNIEAMTANGTYAPGHHETSGLKRSAVNTMVGSK